MERTFLLSVLLLLVGGSCPAPTPAQITSDRPGFVDGAATVAPGTVQGELGYAFSDEAGATAHEFGQFLLRTGLTEQVELRGGLGSYIVNTGDGNGYDGASLGAKVTALSTAKTALGAVATTTVPVGTTPGADDRARQTVKLAFDAALTNRLAIGVNSGANFYYSAGSQNERAPEGLFLAALGGSLSSSVGAFVGYAGFYGKTDNRSWLEGGFTVLATPDTQLDVNGGVRVDGNVDSTFFVGLGIAQRF